MIAGLVEATRGFVLLTENHYPPESPPTGSSGNRLPTARAQRFSQAIGLHQSSSETRR